MRASGPSRLGCGLVLISWAALGADFAGLAGLDGASGDEGRVLDYVRNAIDHPLQSGALGSLIAEFGQGAPRTLVVAGIDEPGFAVSGVDDEGYLQLRPLTRLPFGNRLGEHFAGQPVRVATRTGTLVRGVVAAPSVHFGRSGDFQSSAESEVVVDIGARSRTEARQAGVRLLDRVTLEKSPFSLPGEWLAAPWISSRSGAALLIALARILARETAAGPVTLAWAPQQHYHSAGIAAALASVAKADRTLLVLPHGGRASEIGVIPGQEGGLADRLVKLSEGHGGRLGQRTARSFDFGPFGDLSHWKGHRDVAVLRPAVRNRASPAEMVDLAELRRLVRLLAELAGVKVAVGDRIRFLEPPMGESVPAPPAPKDRDNLQQLLEFLIPAAGVSGHEGPVREALSTVLPRTESAAYRSWVDEAGNLVVRLGTGDAPSAVFLAHMDEIGYSIRSRALGGQLSADLVGGGTPRLFGWRPVTIHTVDGARPGLMTRPGTIEAGGPGGSSSGVADGTVTAAKQYRQLVGSRVSARSLDDRLGCAVLVRVIRRLLPKTRRTGGCVDFVFTVREETGLHGARAYAAREMPARAYAIDTFVTSDTPLEARHYAYARLGEGPVLRAIDDSSMTPVAELARIERLARGAAIPLQAGITAGGNDGSVFRALETANIPIGFPLRYAHTAVETADLADAEAMTDLLERVALEELRGRR